MIKAEHHAKYGNIEKTVRMPVPPTWEEFCKRSKLYYYPYGFNRNYVLGVKKYDNYEEIYITDKIEDEDVFQSLNTKSNYYKALDKMVELWREEV